MAIDILVADVTADDPHAYFEAKLADFFPDMEADEVASLAARGYVPMSLDDVPVAPPELHPEFTDEQRTLLDREAALFARLVNRRSPLLEGETLEKGSDRASYLAEPFGEYAAGTPVFVRRTDRASLLYLYPGASVTAERGFEYRPDREPSADDLAAPDEAPKRKLLGASDVVFKVLVKLATSLASAVGSKVGAAIVAQLFGDEEMQYQRMLEDMGKVVRAANTDQTVAEQAGVIQGVTDDLEVFYRTLRTTGKRELKFEQLREYHNRLSGVLGTLKTRTEEVDFTKVGLPFYIAAASLDLAVYQEMTRVDPDAERPADSFAVEAIRRAAALDAKHVRATRQRIVDDRVAERLSHITDVLNDRFVDGNVGKDRFYFMDRLTGYRSGKFQHVGCKDDPWGRARKARDEYASGKGGFARRAVEAELTWVLEVADAWDALAKRPIPEAAG